MKLAIALPTYNEAPNIKILLPEILKNTADMTDLDTTVFVIDDNSPDGTAKAVSDLAKQLATKQFHIELIKRSRKEGLGKAYVYGFRKILEQPFDYILQMDADLSHDPKYLPQFIEASKSADFVVGSRYIKGGSIPKWSLSRRLQSRGGNLYARLLLGSRISDYTGGYNLYSTGLLRQLDLNNLQAAGYGFLIELKYRALLKCDDVRQVPIVFLDRRHGASKIPKNTILENFLLVPKLRLNKFN